MLYPFLVSAVDRSQEQALSDRLRMAHWPVHHPTSSADALLFLFQQQLPKYHPGRQHSVWVCTWQPSTLEKLSTQLQLPKQAHLHMPCCLLTEKPYLSPFPVVLVGTWERTWANTPPLHVFASLPQLVVSSTTLVDKLFFLHSGGRKTTMQMPDTWSNLETSKDRLHI